MKTMQSIQQGALLLAALVMSLMNAGAARAQDVSARFVGKFTLTSPVLWGKSTLRPGTYTIRIDSMGSPIRAFISKDDSSFGIRIITLVTGDYHNGSNVLRLKVRNGALVVDSLALADLNTVLIYESSPAHENVEEARAATSIPVLVARK